MTLTDITYISNFNRVIPDGKGFVMMKDGVYMIKRPIYRDFQTKAMQRRLARGKITYKDLSKLKWEKEETFFEVNADKLFVFYQTIGTFTAEEEELFNRRKTNEDKFLFIQRRSNLVVVI